MQSVRGVSIHTTVPVAEEQFGVVAARVGAGCSGPLNGDRPVVLRKMQAHTLGFLLSKFKVIRFLEIKPTGS